MTVRTLLSSSRIQSRPSRAGRKSGAPTGMPPMPFSRGSAGEGQGRRTGRSPARPSRRQAFTGRPGRPIFRRISPFSSVIVTFPSRATRTRRGNAGLGGRGGAGGRGRGRRALQLPGQGAGGPPGSRRPGRRAPGRRSGGGRPAAQGLQVPGGDLGQPLRAPGPAGGPPGPPRGPRRPARWACPGTAPGPGTGNRSPPGSGPRGAQAATPGCGWALRKVTMPEKLRWKPRSRAWGAKARSSEKQWMMPPTWSAPSSRRIRRVSAGASRVCTTTGLPSLPRQADVGPEHRFLDVPGAQVVVPVQAGLAHQARVGVLQQGLQPRATWGSQAAGLVGVHAQAGLHPGRRRARSSTRRQSSRSVPTTTKPVTPARRARSSTASAPSGAG